MASRLQAVVVLDEVIVNVTPKWATRMREALPKRAVINRRKGRNPLERNEASLCRWMECPEEIGTPLFLDDRTFYKDLPITKFGESLMVALAKGRMELAVMAFDGSGRPVDESRREFFDRHFRTFGNAARLVLDSKRTDMPGEVRRIGMEGWSLYADDSFDAALSMYREFSRFGKGEGPGREILVPALGYNYDMENVRMMDVMNDAKGGVTATYYRQVLPRLWPTSISPSTKARKK